MNESPIKNAKIESVAKILIIDNTKHALVLTLGKHLAQPEKSFSPDLPGGMVESGEFEKDGAIRETEEEAGIILDAKDVYLTYAKTEFYPAENKSISKFLYVCHIDTTPEVVLSWEHSAYAWIPLDELLQTTEFRRFYLEAIEYSLKNRLV